MTQTYKITKVKREDNKIFRIGDLAFSPKGSRTIHEIKSFKILQRKSSKRKVDDIWVYWTNDAGGNWLAAIEHCKHYRVAE